MASKIHESKNNSIYKKIHNKSVKRWWNLIQNLKRKQWRYSNYFKNHDQIITKKNTFNKPTLDIYLIQTLQIGLLWSSLQSHYWFLIIIWIWNKIQKFLIYWIETFTALVYWVYCSRYLFCRHDVIKFKYFRSKFLRF